MPLGDLGATYLHLLVAHPEVNWHFSYRLVAPASHDGLTKAMDFELDDQELKEILEDVPLCEPEVLAYLRGLLAPVTSACLNPLQVIPALNRATL